MADHSSRYLRAVREVIVDWMLIALISLSVISIVAVIMLIFYVLAFSVLATIFLSIVDAISKRYK